MQSLFQTLIIRLRSLYRANGIGWVDGVTYEHSAKENVEAVKMLLGLGLDPNAANHDGRTPLMGAAFKGRNEVIQVLVDHGAILDQRDKGSRDTDKAGSKLAGLSILLQAKNLTDRPFITYQNNDPRQVIDYQRYGRDYYIGLAYKF